MSKKEKARKIAEMMKEQTERYGLPTRPKSNKKKKSSR